MLATTLQNQTVAVYYPGLETIFDLVINSVDSPESKRTYRRHLEAFLAWYIQQGRPELCAALVKQYRAELQASGLGSASINLRLVVVRRLAAEAADNALIDERLSNGIARIKGIKAAGRKIGNWLSKSQAEQLINAPATSRIKGLRDRALLAVLIGCGLRREECAGLTFEQIQLREARWVIVDLVGKGNKTRSIPMPAFAKAALESWAQAARLSQGRVFRQLSRGGRVMGEGITPQAIRDVVAAYGCKIGVTISPHDLRRTFAKLAHKGGAGLEQIRLSLGHASIKTTEIYLGASQDLSDAPCDHLGLNLTEA
ncbi:MAG: tyrosine-type recombinase/integrase [Chloroflexi bacterium]|nr:tyrosine-type recombinase/integrase [Chloroflexota bacterium]